MSELDAFLYREDVEINASNKWGSTPLMSLIENNSEASLEKVFPLLIERGASINATNILGRSCLHYGKIYKYDSVVNILRESDVDVNKQDAAGKTPLYLACEHPTPSENAINFLLEKNADPLIETNRDLIPLVAITSKSQAFTDRMIDYTFKNKKPVSLKLRWLVEAMTKDSPVFPRLCDESFNVEWTNEDLRHLNNHMCEYVPAHLMLFIQKHGHIVRKMFDHLPAANPVSNIVHMMWWCCGSTRYRRYLGLLTTIINSPIVDVFLRPLQINSFMVSYVVTRLQDELRTEELAMLARFLIIQGVPVTSMDVDIISEIFDAAELNRILSSADVIDMKKLIFPANLEYNEQPLRRTIDFVPVDCVLEYDFYLDNKKVMSYLSGAAWSESRTHASMKYLDFFLHPKMKRIQWKDKAMRDRLERMPKVPSLTQLSRDASRNFLIDRYDIKTYREFNSMLERLPIASFYKRIILFQVRLY
jgi:hypothetical protein